MKSVFTRPHVALMPTYLLYGKSDVRLRLLIANLLHALKLWALHELGKILKILLLLVRERRKSYYNEAKRFLQLCLTFTIKILQGGKLNWANIMKILASV